MNGSMNIRKKIKMLTEDERERLELVETIA